MHPSNSRSYTNDVNKIYSCDHWHIDVDDCGYAMALVLDTGLFAVRVEFRPVEMNSCRRPGDTS